MLRICIPFVLVIFYRCRATPLTGENVRLAKDAEFPFVVSLSRYNIIKTAHEERNHFCGGALITKKLVLTAAHCFTNIKHPTDFVIKVKSRDLQNAKIHRVKRWVIYNEWIRTEVIEGNTNDIAIVKLRKCVSSSIKLAIVTNLPEAQLYGKKAVTAGWGFTDDGEKSRYLLTADLNVLHPEDCLGNSNRDVGNQMNDTSQMFLCTSADPPVCLQRADSGSPLVIEGNQVIGVNKGICYHNVNGSVVEKQNLHVSVNYYKVFIEDVLEQKKKKCCAPL